MANFLPFDKFTLFTRLSIDEVNDALLNNVNAGPDAWRNSDVYTGKVYYGRVNINTFTILPVVGWPSKIVIFIEGKIVSDRDGKTLIEIYVHPDFIIAGIIGGGMVLWRYSLLLWLTCSMIIILFSCRQLYNFCLTHHLFGP